MRGRGRSHPTSNNKMSRKNVNHEWFVVPGLSIEIYKKLCYGKLEKSQPVAKWCECAGMNLGQE